MWAIDACACVCADRGRKTGKRTTDLHVLEPCVLGRKAGAAPGEAHEAALLLLREGGQHLPEQLDRHVLFVGYTWVSRHDDDPCIYPPFTHTKPKHTQHAPPPCTPSRSCAAARRPGQTWGTRTPASRAPATSGAGACPAAPARRARGRWPGSVFGGGGDWWWCVGFGGH